MKMTDEQEKVCNSLLEWFKSVYFKKFGNQFYDQLRVVVGYAGTGKTFLISCFRKALYSEFSVDRKIAFCTFTGKASSVLKQTLEKNKSYFPLIDNVSTIHSLIYKPIFGFEKDTNKKIIIGWERRESLDYDLIIIDEASMISSDVFLDLSSFKIPIIAFGDHGQLPPVTNDNNFSLVTSPNYTLTKIHRQALDNPIINLSIKVRKEGSIPYGIFNKSVFKLDRNGKEWRKVFNSIDFDENTIILCGFNKTRTLINKDIRKRMSFILEEPYPSERLICLKNNSISGVMNGQTGTLLWLVPISKEFYAMDIQVDGTNQIYNGLVHRMYFGKEKYDEFWGKINPKKHKKILDETGFKAIDLFDFGYAISVHRSQGSEWKRVILFEERSSYWDDDYYKKWLYTAITRSKEKLFIVG